MLSVPGLLLASIIACALTSSVVNPNGNFTIAFLLYGNYRVDIEDSAEPAKTFSVADVIVNIDEDTDLGDITLE